MNDKAYDEVKSEAINKGLNLKEYVGSTQLLNSYSKLNSFDHPAYNNVFSYGLPTIGNGRRTLADFADQSKNHVDKEQLQKFLTESVVSTLKGKGKEVVEGEIDGIISQALDGDFAANVMQTANQIASKYNVAVGQISECIRDVSTLSKLKFNKENLSKSVLTVIRIANKYLPEKYKSELYSTFIDEYSEKVSELINKADSIKAELKKGMDVVSNNLSNYAINFFDEGTFNVPALSAIGKNVQAFKESSVTRVGYSLNKFVQENKTKYSDLNNYIERVSKVGELEKTRQDIDEGLKYGCEAAELVGAGEICRAGQFIANVALIAKVSVDIGKAMEMVHSLESAKYIAVEQSLKSKPKYSSWTDREGRSHDIEFSDMENMLFGTPVVSLQTVRVKDSAESIIPLVLYKKMGDIKGYEGVSKDPAAYAYSFPESEFTEISRNHLTNSNSVMVKDVHSEWKDGRLLENARYAALDAFTVRNFIQEYRFIIDDFQPDSLRLIKFDFNAREQVAYERDGNFWYVYRGKANHWDPVAVDTLSESPVQKDGLFVFQPKDVLNRGVTNEKDSLLLSAVQEDGANSVSIYVVNKAGYANNQRITFKFQAVDYILDEGWPKSFERVSRMDTVDFYSNDWGYGVSLGQYRLIVTSSQDVDTVKVSVDSLHGNGARYRFWADLSPIWKKHPLKDTVYTLKWDLGFKTKTLKEDGTTGEQLRNYSPQVTVLGDVSAPKLVFDTSYTPKAVSLNNNGILAYVINQDSADSRVLRGLRSYIVRKNTKDMIMLLHKAYVGEPSYEIRWDREPASWSDTVDLYVQAFDLANPDSVMKKALLSVSKDAADSLWSLVMEDDSTSGDTTFKSGINGISLHKKILVDNDAPQIVKENITFRSAADADLPVFSRQKNGADLLLNAKDTLMVSFDVEENLLGRDAETISVELVFKDSLSKGEVKFKRYLSDFVVRNSLKRFVFEELDVDRLDDGVYSLTVSLIDEAGNRSEKRIMEKLRVDRTSPQVHGVSLGDVAYKNVAELKKGTAHLSQSIDDARNRSSLACYVKVDVNNNVGKWVGPVAETVSKDALYSNYEFDIRGAASDTSKGFWYVYFGCYDEAGNFGKNMNFMGMGSRYPQITYPQSGSGSYVDQILIRGIAPNPDVQGNSNKGMFSITWQKQGDSTWSERGIDYLVFDRSLALTERDLAVWNTSGLDLDGRSYILKLSVKSCDSCEWVSNERTVAVDAFVPPDTANAPKIVITPPVGTHVAGQVKDVSIELRNVPDTSKWFVSATIEAPSPKDSTVYVKTVGKVFDPMAISPFRTPAAPSDTGLSIWQEDDDSTWHVRYVGNAKGPEIRGDSSEIDSTILRMTPYLAIRFVDGRIDWSTSAKADSSDSLGFMMDSIKVKNEFVDMDVPPYNMTKMWKVGTDSVHLKFKTTSPFTVDASLIEGVLYRDTLSPVVYIFPEKYKAHVAWDGLVNGASSRGSLVKMSVVAYEKGNEKNIISQDAEWFLEYEKTGIEFSSNNLNQYYINFLGTGLDSAEMKLGDYGFQFKLTGRSAYVTAKILDSAKTEVYTLLDSEFVFATSTNQWKTLRWNGEKNDHFYKEGTYNVHILVENETGVIIDTLYPFEVSLGENIKEARIDSVGRIADLKMLEASLDSNGKYRYVGKPDYILRTNVSATVLPKNARTFDYEWDVYGTQKPTLYKKTRPSLGIRRHRNEFWATVVTLVMTETRKYQISYCGIDKCCYEIDDHRVSRGYFYRIDVKKQKFRKGELNPEISVDLNPANGTDSYVYGYYDNRHDPAPVTLHNLAAIKILPASSYEIVKGYLGNDTTYFSNAVWETDCCSSSDDLLWENIYVKEWYNDGSVIKNWFDNWGGQALYYEAVNDNFDVTANSAALNNTFNSKSTKTICQADNLKDTVLAKNDSKFVCGAKMAKDEVDTSIITQFNPHAYMMNVILKPYDGNESFAIKNFDKDDCGEMDNSSTDIKVKFVLEIDSNYWNPPTDRWGTNNLANRYVRFDPLNQTLYGDEGYIRKLKNISNPPESNFVNFYNGSTWTIDTTFNNGPTVFETQRLWMWPVAENPLMFNDEIDSTRLNQDPDLYPEAKFYPSEYSWRFYCAKCDVAYKAEARSLLSGDLLDQFLSKDGLNGDKTIRKNISLPYDIYFDVAPVMTFDEARNAGIIISGDAVKYPLGDETSCSSDTTGGYRFYGCDKWVSRVHMERHDWNESQWDSTFILPNGYIRNPLTDINAINDSLTSVGVPQNAMVSVDKHQSHIVKTTEWNEQENRWSIELNKTDSDVDKLGGISIDKYELNYDKTSGWKIDTDNSKIGEGKYKLYHVGRQTEPSIIDFYRSRDTVFTSENSLNNRLSDDIIPLKSVVAQSSELADTILSSKWAKNPSANVLGVFKRNIKGDTVLHPYLIANYDSASSKFTVTRNSLDIYASREDEIVTLQGSVPYDINNWSISYIQNGMRFKVADGTQAPIEATMNVSQLQGNTSFFLTYNVLGDITNYRQLDVHIGEHVKANETSDVYSMYGNVNIHFEKNAWEKDEDVTVRTMDPKECYDCDLFRNMVPVGPVLEVQPSHKFPEGKEPLVTVDISVQTLVDDGIDYSNLKIYKLDPRKPEIVPLEIGNEKILLDANLNRCDSSDWQHSCKFVRINAKTPTFSEFVILDSLKADSIMVADSIPEKIEQFSCSQMDTLWMDTLWMGTANGWLEFPYLCTGRSNYLLQLNAKGNVSAEHRGASTRPIVWTAKNTDLYALDSMYQSSVVFYGIDGNTEQKLGPVVRLDSVAPVIENLETSVSENEDGSRIVHVETEIEEAGSGVAKTTMELFLGGNLLHSVTIPENQAPVYDFMVDKQSLYSCVGCMATIKVIVEDKGHNSDEVVKQTEKLYPYPLSLVLWYPFAEGSGKIGYELMTMDNPQKMHMDLVSIDNPWNGRYGVHLFKAADSASSRQYKLAKLDSLRPFTFEFNYSAGNTQHANWAILSFVGKNEWTFGVGTYNRYFLKVGDELYYFNTKRDANIPTHLAVVVNGKNVNLYKNGEYVETVRLGSELLYGGSGRLSIGARGELRSAVGNISNLRFYSSALTATQIQGIYNGILSDETINIEAVRAVALADRNGLIVDQSCSAPGKAYLRQKSVDNSGVMIWHADLKSDNYSLYILHRNYVSEDSKVEIFVNGNSSGTYKLTSTGLWKSEKVAGVTLNLKMGVNEIGIRPLGNLGIAALALASTSANIDGNQIGYNEHSWTNPEPKAKVFMKYEAMDDKKWAQVRFDMRNQTGQALENAKIRYYYKGEGENVNAVSFYPNAPMSVVNDAGSVFYAEFALPEAIAAYGTVYSGQGPLIGLHRLTSPNDYFPYWDKTDDPSYLKQAETEYVEATGVALLDSEGNLLNEFACYDEDGPMQKAKIKVRVMAKDNSYGSSSVSDIAAYVENIGNAPVDGFEMRYYFRDTAKTDLDINWSAFATNSKVNAGGDLYYISFMYDVILNSGDKSDYGSGVQFALHHPNRTNDFNAADDPSHHNLNNSGMVEADSIVVLDRRGNLLWGYAPQPKFSENYVTKESYAELVHREGDVIFVNIEENGYYTLETVNAIGIPLKTLYKGIWNVGEHSVTVDLSTLQPSSFIVLRRGTEILSWNLLN